MGRILETGRRKGRCRKLNSKTATIVISKRSELRCMGYIT